VTSRAQIETELKAHKKVMELTEARMRVLMQDLAALEEIPPAPTDSWLTVSLQFEPAGPLYRFLILHVHDKGYYTTGSRGDNSFFATWADLWKYLNSEDIYSRSAISALVFGDILFPNVRKP
jgi:hypothetical protein